MIDEKKLIEEIKSFRMIVTGIRSGKGILREFEKHYKESILRIIDEQQKVGEWIPCSKQLPNDANDVLCFYEYRSMDGINEGELRQRYGIGYYLKALKAWGGDVVCGADAKVIAWMPLPKVIYWIPLPKAYEGENK